jgi:phosphonate transport system substrate-binding protein
MVFEFSRTGEARAEQNIPVLTFAVSPQQSAAKLAATWGPVLAEISAKAGVKLEFRTTPDNPTFGQRLAAGDYDIAYMNPYYYIIEHDKQGYRAIAKEQDRKLQGLIVVRSDSHIKSIEELKGQVLAFPSPASFAASVLPRAALQRKGIDFQTKYVNSHDSVYFAVADGLFPAGGGIVRTLEATSPDTRNALRVLWTTERYTPHAIAAHPRGPATVSKRIVAAMTALDDTEEGKALLAGISFKGIESAENANWDDVRKLGITPDDVEE